MNIKEITLNEPLRVIIRIKNEISEYLTFQYQGRKTYNVFTAIIPKHKRMINIKKNNKVKKLEVNFLEMMFIVIPNSNIDFCLNVGVVKYDRLYSTVLNKTQIGICGCEINVKHSCDAKKVIDWYYTSTFQQLEFNYNQTFNDEIYEVYNYQFPQLNL